MPPFHEYLHKKANIAHAVIVLREVDWLVHAYINVLNSMEKIRPTNTQSMGRGRVLPTPKRQRTGDKASEWLGVGSTSPHLFPNCVSFRLQFLALYSLIILLERIWGLDIKALVREKWLKFGMNPWSFYTSRIIFRSRFGFTRGESHRRCVTNQFPINGRISVFVLSLPFV